MLHRNLRVERVLGAWRKDPATYFAALPSELIWMISLWTTPDVFSSEIIQEKWGQFQNHDEDGSYHRVFPLTDTAMIVDSVFEVYYLDGVNPPRRVDERWADGRLMAGPPGTLWCRDEEQKFTHWDPVHDKILAEITPPPELTRQGYLNKTVFGYSGSSHWEAFLFDEEFQLIDERSEWNEISHVIRDFTVQPKGQVATLIIGDAYYLIFLPLNKHQVELLYDGLGDVFLLSYTEDFHEFYSIDQHTVRYHIPPEKSSQKQEWLVAMEIDLPEDFQITDLKILTNGQLIVAGEHLATKQVIIYKIY